MAGGDKEKAKIEDKAARQVAFSKRKKGLIKKAYELCVLCGIDIALLLFSPSGRLTQFSGPKRTEEVLTRYMNMKDEEREEVIQSREYWIKTLKEIMTKDDKELQLSKAENANPQMQELQREVDMLQQQLQFAEEQLRFYEPGAQSDLAFKSMGELESMEQHLLSTLAHISQRKEYLSGNPLSYRDLSCLEGKMGTYLENRVTDQYFAPLQTSWDLSCIPEYPTLLRGSSSRMGEMFNDPNAENFPIWWPPSSFLSPPIQLQDEAGGQSTAAEEQIPPDEPCGGEGYS